MIKHKYGKADLTPATRFQVKYLGRGMTEEPGLAGIEKAVQKIQERAKVDSKSCPKMYLEVEHDCVKFTEVKTKSAMNIAVRNISYCTLNRSDSTIFAFNHHKSSSVVECHAVSCDSEDKAKSIALALYAAFREGHFQKLRRERKKSFEQKHVERRASFENHEPRNSSHNTATETLASADSENSLHSARCANHSEPPCNDIHSIDIHYEEELELDKIIEDLLSTVEIEKAKIEQGVE